MKQIARNGGTTEIEIPGDADRPCRINGCQGTLQPTVDSLNVDEGHGGASVDLVCDLNTSHQSTHYWNLSDDEYEAEFGHPFNG